MYEAPTKYNSGVLGASQSVGTDIASINNPGIGNYRIWGTVRHSLADGCRLLIGSTTVLSRIPSVATVTQDFGPIIYNIANATDDITLELAVATGASDSAAAMIFAQRIDV